MTTLSDRLSLVRDHFAESARAMSLRVGLGESTWQKYEEHGRVPEERVLAQLYEEGVDLNWLMTGSGQMMRLSDHTYPGYCSIIEDGARSDRVDLVPEAMAAAIPLALPFIDGVRESDDRDLWVVAGRTLIGCYHVAFWQWFREQQAKKDTGGTR